MKQEKPLTVGRLAKLTGLSTKSIRYYERERLIPKADRSRAGYRLYSGRIIERLRFIQKAKMLGFSLGDVRQILDLADRGKPCCDKVYEWSERRLRELDDQIRFLSNLKARLTRYRHEWETGGRTRANLPEAEICGLIEKVKLEEDRL